MSKTRNLSDLLDANGDVKSGALDNVPASDLINDTTPQLGGNLDCNTFDISFGDNEKARFGNADDLKIYHNGSHSIIEDVGTGKLEIRSNGTGVDIQKENAEFMARFITDGGVELYHDHSKKLETTSSGATVTGTLTADGLSLGDNEKAQFGASNDLQIYHDTTAGNSYIKDNGTGYLILQASTNLQLRGVNNEVFLNAGENGSVDLYYDNSKKLETTSTGVQITGNMFASTGETISVGAWCKFLGTGTINLQDDYNVSSIGDVSNGQYDINFSTNCNNADYAIAGTSTATNHSGWNIKSAGIQSAPTKLQTGSVRIVTENSDSYYVSFMAFGDW